MESTINKRVKELIESQNLNDYSFSKRIGKSNTAVSKITKGESKPGFDMLEAIFQEFPDLSREWVIDGVGQMWKTSTAQQLQQQSVSPDDYLQDYLKKLETKFESVLAQKDSVIENLKDIIQYQRQLLDSSKRSFHKPATLPASMPMSKNLAVSVTA